MNTWFIFRPWIVNIFSLRARVKNHFDTRDDFYITIKAFAQKKHIVLKTRETSNEISMKK